MNNTDKKHLLKWNTILWLLAMALPAFFSIALASTRFPWPMIIPLLLLGPMLHSNNMLKAVGHSTAALKWNTLLWLAAMLFPAVFSIALASARFPWPMIFPFLLLGPMLYSNKMLTQTIGDSAIPPSPK